jgi:hypothetical protein
LSERENPAAKSTLTTSLTFYFKVILRTFIKGHISQIYLWYQLYRLQHNQGRQKPLTLPNHRMELCYNTLANFFVHLLASQKHVCVGKILPGAYLGGGHTRFGMTNSAVADQRIKCPIMLGFYRSQIRQNV